ncbi:cytochrome P450 [Melanogaster broomeanus]|nr:cytochrome P450 [Melanogaster broomeanus]
MSSDRLQTVAGIVATISVVTFLYNKYQAAPATKNGIPLPPGPPARWFWQSEFPRSKFVHTLADWVARYGPVISLRAGSRVIIVIGRLDAATEIMEKEGGALVDRPRSVAVGEMLSNNMRIVAAGSGEQFRRLRKAVHTHLQPKAAEAYQDLQHEHARDFILDILRDPKHHFEHIKRFTVSVILHVTYGKSTPTANDDPEVVRIYQNSKNLSRVARPGAYLVDIFPILKYVPGYGRDLRKHHEFELALFRDQLSRVKDEMSRNEANPSFGKTLLENAGNHRLSYDEMAYLASSLFGAGSDTTSIAMTILIMAAARHPEAQARVQEELDMVVGMDRGEPMRLPTFEDSDELPQLHAFISEALRWRPVTPTGISHRATEDIIWRGQIIPAGATVLGCHWAISRDPVAFPDPEKFYPQRWLDPNGQLRIDLRFYTYGFGRSSLFLFVFVHNDSTLYDVPLTRWLALNWTEYAQGSANRSLYITLALLLWSFRIAERPDVPIDVDTFTDTIISCASPFEVDFVPRKEEERLRQMMKTSM